MRHGKANIQKRKQSRAVSFTDLFSVSPHHVNILSLFPQSLPPRDHEWPFLRTSWGASGWQTEQPIWTAGCTNLPFRLGFALWHLVQSVYFSKYAREFRSEIKEVKTIGISSSVFSLISLCVPHGSQSSDVPLETPLNAYCKICRCQSVPINIVGKWQRKVILPCCPWQL